jgi:hypothetical protein
MVTGLQTTDNIAGSEFLTAEAYFSALKMEAIDFQQTIWRYIPEDRIHDKTIFFIFYSLDFQAERGRWEILN